jgi:lactate dehydrogenase-like 2-hydroxyacid dehydrogenase
MESDKAERATRTVLICDAVGLLPGADGKPDCSAVRAHILARGGTFTHGPLLERVGLAPGAVHFYYQPELYKESELLAAAAGGRYDAVIAAATFIPEQARFRCGGVRIGSGTGNMASVSWGGPDGRGGEAPLMNTPGCNARATAQSVLKAIFKVLPDLPVDELHALVLAAQFDTGRDLKRYPTAKLEGRALAVLGFGHVGRTVAGLGRALGMKVSVYARERDRSWIEAAGYRYGATPEDAAAGADVLSVHLGLGARDPAAGRFANAALVGAAVLAALNAPSVIVNYDRGELIDLVALEAALACGRVRHVAVDADIFVDPTTGAVSGPLQPYLEAARRHPGKFALLPHAAADTDHPSRVAGALQAVDQILDAMQNRRLVNVKGDVPPGYVDAGPKVAAGVGRVRAQDLVRIATDPSRLARLCSTSRRMADFWEALARETDPARRRSLIEQQGEALLRGGLEQRTLYDDLGLYAPYSG